MYNGLDEDYRPPGRADAIPHPPTYPSRLRHFVYGCGLMALDNESRLAGGKSGQRVSRALGG
jgi:hypothetical protein